MTDGIFGGLENSAGPDIIELEIAKIVPDPDQPRKTFDDTELGELAASIETHGLITPIIVRASDTERGKYVITAGERRYRAHEKLSKSHINAIVRNDANAAAVAIIENVQRVDLNALEEADAIARLMEADGLSQSKVAALLGKNRATINQLLKLHTLPEEIRADIDAQNQSKTTLIELATVEDAGLQLELWEMVKRGALSITGLRQVTRSGAPTAPAKKKAGTKSPLSPTETALLRISSGVSGLKGKDISTADRKRIQALIDHLSDLL